MGSENVSNPCCTPSLYSAATLVGGSAKSRTKPHRFNLTSRASSSAQCRASTIFAALEGAKCSPVLNDGVDGAAAVTKHNRQNPKRLLCPAMDVCDRFVQK